MPDREDQRATTANRSTPRLPRRLALFGAVAIASSVLAAAALKTEALERLETATIDFRFQSVGGPKPQFEDVTVIGIDERTADELNRRIPLPRSYHARAIERLRQAKVKVVAYDLQFTEMTEPEEDLALLEAVDHTRRMVLATGKVGPKGEHSILGGEENLKDLGVVAGYSGLPFDDDGVLRRLVHSHSGLRTFSVAAAELASGKAVDRKAFERGEAWINFRGPPGSTETESFVDLLRGDIRAGDLQNKVVIVGATDPIAGDIHRTAASDTVMSGAEIQANAITTIVDGFPVVSSPEWIGILLIGALAAVGSFAGIPLRPTLFFLPAAAALVLFLAAVAMAFRSGVVVPVSYPLGGLVLSSAGAFGVKYLTEIRERRKLRRLFSQFVPDKVVEDAIAAGGHDLRLDASKLEATVMFCDLRGFTRFSEEREPSVVSAALNRYLTEMTDAIQAQEGTIVSYMGDGIMAVFGAPVQHSDHAARAVAAATEMVTLRLDRFNAWLRTRGVDHRFEMGIGLNTGDVMSGAIGSGKRLEYTTLGDTTNVAARLESVTKKAGYPILMSDTTRDMLGEAGPKVVCVGDIALAGRGEPCTAWTVAEDLGQAADLEHT